MEASCQSWGVADRPRAQQFHLPGVTEDCEVGQTIDELEFPAAGAAGGHQANGVRPRLRRTGRVRPEKLRIDLPLLILKLQAYRVDEQLTEEE
jgi:hypothetical protein